MAIWSNKALKQNTIPICAAKILGPALILLLFKFSTLTNHLLIKLTGLYFPSKNPRIEKSMARKARIAGFFVIMNIITNRNEMRALIRAPRSFILLLVIGQTDSIIEWLIQDKNKR